MESIIRIAIADDHEIVLNGVREIITGFGGFSVDIVANNGKELFQKISTASVLPDIVITDISMPVWDGYETLDAIRKKWPKMTNFTTKKITKVQKSIIPSVIPLSHSTIGTLNVFE